MERYHSENFFSDGIHSAVEQYIRTIPGGEYFYQRADRNNGTRQHWLSQLGQAYGVLRERVANGEDVSRAILSEYGKGWLTGKRFRPLDDFPKEYVLYRHHFVTEKTRKEEARGEDVSPGSKHDQHRMADYRDCTCLYCPSLLGRMERLYLSTTRPKFWQTSKGRTSAPAISNIAEAPAVIFRVGEIVWVPVAVSLDDTSQVNDGSEFWKAYKQAERDEEYPQAVSYNIQQRKLDCLRRIFYWPCQIKSRTISLIVERRDGDLRAIMNVAAADMPHLLKVL
ncbi:hypothetical protein HDV00_001870 [Rhizophlyctis rosea]|nr:hypothetical protein HDV00_001870 [Rhizophlyctis rosea]